MRFHVRPFFYGETMNYYEAKQRKSDGRWDYTRNNEPTGYCCRFREYNQEFVEKFHISEEEVDKHNSFAHKYHSGGHETEQEARECYKQYLLDHQLRFWKTKDEQRKCQICKQWTQNVAEIGCRMFTLCDEHNNCEEVSGLFDAPTWSMSSW